MDNISKILVMTMLSNIPRVVSTHGKIYTYAMVARHPITNESKDTYVKVMCDDSTDITTVITNAMDATVEHLGVDEVLSICGHLSLGYTSFNSDTINDVASASTWMSVTHKHVPTVKVDFPGLNEYSVPILGNLATTALMLPVKSADNHVVYDILMYNLMEPLPMESVSIRKWKRRTLAKSVGDQAVSDKRIETRKNVFMRPGVVCPLATQHELYQYDSQEQLEHICFAAINAHNKHIADNLEAGAVYCHFKVQADNKYVVLHVSGIDPIDETVDVLVDNYTNDIALRIQMTTWIMKHLVE